VSIAVGIDSELSWKLRV